VERSSSPLKTGAPWLFNVKQYHPECSEPIPLALNADPSAAARALRFFASPQDDNSKLETLQANLVCMQPRAFQHHS
jgi:hypothetical protein